MKRKENFLNHPWHDAEILAIVIDRHQPGNKDTIDISIRWPNGKEAILSFIDCYGAELLLNFGVNATESILSVGYIEDSQDVAEIKNKWATLGVEIPDLVRFEIETNSTASRLRIYAINFSVMAQ